MNDDNPIRLRISAKKLYENIFYDAEMKDFFDFAGYKLSDGANSVEKRAEALAQYCSSPKFTTRRWINGESQPNATNTFMIYVGLLAKVYDDDHHLMISEFITWHDRTLLPKYLLDENENNGA